MCRGTYGLHARRPPPFFTKLQYTVAMAAAYIILAL